MKNRIFSAAAVLVLLFSLTSCGVYTGSAAASASGEKPVIAVTIVPEATFAKAVCGGRMDVVTAVPPGYSPETYEPTPKDTEALSLAALYFAIGVPAEEASILPALKDRKGMKIVRLQDAVAQQYPDRKFPSGERDPHIWLSPKRAQVMVQAIARECGAADPKNQNFYTQNAQKYNEQLTALDSNLKTVFSKIQNKTFLAFHPAFGYLAQDYGLTMYSLEEEGKEATPQHLQEMVDLAKTKQIKAIFYQEEIDSKQSQAFAEEIGGKTVQLAPLAPDYMDNLKKMASTMAEDMK